MVSVLLLSKYYPNAAVNITCQVDLAAEVTTQDIDTGIKQGRKKEP